MASSALDLTPRAREIVAAARELLEAEGPEGLSMRRLADKVGIRAPSIYKHLPDKEALEAALISAGFEEWADAFKGETPEELGRAYRAYARAHPHLYRLMTDRPLARERLTPGVEARAASASPWTASTIGCAARSSTPGVSRSRASGRSVISRYRCGWASA